MGNRRGKRGGKSAGSGAGVSVSTVQPGISRADYQREVLAAAGTILGLTKEPVRITNFVGGSGYDGANISPMRGRVPWATSDTRYDLSQMDREALMMGSRWLQKNVGFAEKGVSGVADHIGYLNPQPNTADREWNDIALPHFADHVSQPEIFDRAGKLDWIDWQISMSRYDMSDGDSLTALTADRLGRPQILMYEAHQIGSGYAAGDNQAVPAGLIETDGVLTDRLGRDKYYRVRHGVGKESVSRLLRRRDCIFSRNLKRYNRVRGETSLARALTNSLDIIEIRAYIKAAMKAAGEHVWQEIEVGNNMPDLFHPAAYQGREVAREPDGSIVDKEDASEAATVIKIADLVGAVKAIQMKNGRKLELITDSRPHPNQREFLEDLLRDVALGIGVFPEILFLISGLSGQAMRFALKDFTMFLRRRRAARIKHVDKYYRYFWAREFRRGFPMPKDPHWWKCIWIPQADVSIDEGRDGNLELKQLEAGTTTLAKLTGQRGEHWEDVMEQRAREFKRAMEFAELYGLDDWRELLGGASSMKPNWKEGPGTKAMGLGEVIGGQ